MTNTSAIQKLKEAGYSVKIRHYRPILANGKIREVPYSRITREMGGAVLANGGETIVVLLDGAGRMAIGKAKCSTKDQFCYKVGTKIALNRARDEMEARLEYNESQFTETVSEIVR